MARADINLVRILSMNILGIEVLSHITLTIFFTMVVVFSRYLFKNFKVGEKIQSQTQAILFKNIDNDLPF